MFDKPIDFSDAINSLCPGAEWKIEDNNLENIEWFSSDIDMPSIQDIVLEKERLEQVRVDEIAQKEALRQSAIEKLSLLGLTEDEAKALIGV